MCLQSHISGLKEEELETHKKALEVRRLEKPKTMAEECQRYWSEISAGTYYFNRGWPFLRGDLHYMIQSLLHFFNFKVKNLEVLNIYEASIGL